MLDLRSLDPARQSADRRVALAVAYGAMAVVTFVAVLAGGGVEALVLGVVLGLTALPWVFAFGGRWRLLDDALAGTPFVWRGDRAGVWATAPTTGTLATLAVAATLDFSTGLALFVSLLGGAAYTALIAWAERRYERAILLDLTVLELRFRRITDARVRVDSASARRDDPSAVAGRERDVASRDALGPAAGGA
jgi:hypothetical protein